MALGSDSKPAAVGSQVSVPPWKFVIDILILAAFGTPILIYTISGKAFKRGFYCDDESLRYPYKDSTVPSIYLYIVGMVVNLTAIFVLEILIWRKKNRPTVRLFGREVPECVYEIYMVIFTLLIGMASSQLLTDLVKYNVGRLRPHFYNICSPISPKTKEPICAQTTGWEYIDHYECSGTDDKKLKDMRLSFPSGHSSFAMYTALFFAIYIQARFKETTMFKSCKHALQIASITLAVWVGCTRIADYKHHWSDVLAGLVLGGTVAVLTVVAVSKFFHKNVIIKQPSNSTATHELINLNGNTTSETIP